MARRKILLNKDEITQIQSYWERNSSSETSKSGVGKCIQHLAKKQNDGLTSYLSDYVIIRSVTEIEVFCKSSAVTMIDNFNCPLPDMGVTTSLEELKLLDRVTLGEIAAEQFNFQNIHDIDKMFSHLLEMKFLDEMKQCGVDVGTLVKLINVRHKIVHEMKSFDGTFEQLNKFNRTSHDFVFESARLFLEIFGPDQNDIGD